jgi:hypothetical protein
VTTVAVLNGGVVAPPIEIKQVGFLDAIDISIRSPAGVGIVTTTAPALATNRLNVASIINRVQVALNTGAAVIVDVTGEQLAFINTAIEQGYSPFTSVADLQSPLPGSSTGSLPASATIPLNWNVRIPIAANNGRDFTTGLLMLQSQQVLCQVNVSFNALSVLYPTNTPTYTATLPSMDITAVTYAAPDPSKVQLPLPSLHRILETTFPIVNTGDVIIRLPREGILLRLYLLLVINGVMEGQGSPPTYNLNSVRVRLNDVDEPLFMTRQQLQAEQQRHFGLGVSFPYLLDFWYAEKTVAQGDARDAYDTEKFSTFELILNIPSGTSLGTNSYVSVAREIVQYPRRTA